ncbi:NAD(P)(+)--arginine ADP-ribosyltransferase 2-like [Acridotheres tristis]
MAPPPLTLALLALTVATPVATPLPPLAPSVPPLVEVSLDMSPSSFDDRYRGCGPAMAAALRALNGSELRRGGAWPEAWALAAAEWRRRRSPAVSPVSPGVSPVSPVSPAVSPLSPDQAKALLAYTAPLPLHRDFNAAVRWAGRSGRDYRDHFHFKTLHFLLSRGLAALRAARGPRCHRVFRGVRGLRFQARPGRAVRFGHFASASARNESSWAFGSDTAFQKRSSRRDGTGWGTEREIGLYTQTAGLPRNDIGCPKVCTCHGASIREFSFFPHEDEVLIPPFETFNVTKVIPKGDKVEIHLDSTGTYSKYNCEWVTGGSGPRAPGHLAGLLVATTALAVATGIL